VCERIPYPILLVRQLSRESSGTPPKRYAQAVSSRRACTEPSVEPDRYERVAKVTRASRRASRRTRLEPNHFSGAIRASRRSRLGPFVEAIRASRRASRRACVERPTEYDLSSDPSSNPSRKPSGKLTSARAGGRFKYRTEPLRLFRW